MINDSTMDMCVNFRCTIITTTTNLEQILIENNITHPCKVTNDWEIAFNIYADIYLDNMRFRKDTLLTIIVKTGVFFVFSRTFVGSAWMSASETYTSFLFYCF